MILSPVPPLEEPALLLILALVVLGAGFIGYILGVMRRTRGEEDSRVHHH